MGEKLNINKIYGCIAENREKQDDIAKLLNISVTALNKKLNGKSNFSIDDMEKIAYHYKKNVGYFFD